MSKKALLIDSSRCVACRGCQVACKQWNELEAEETKNRGTYQNPADLSGKTWTLVRFKEVTDGGELKWSFLKDQCRHCLEPLCASINEGRPGAVEQDECGAVIHTAKSKGVSLDEVLCPYDIPRLDTDGVLKKCTMCLDRVKNGMLPACVKTCTTGALIFGERKEVLAQAKARLARLKKGSPEAQLVDPDDVSVIYLLTEGEDKYAARVKAKPGNKELLAGRIAGRQHSRRSLLTSILS